MAASTGEFGEKMNAMAKVVVSSALTDPAWQNTTVIAGNLPEEVARLKQRYPGDVLVAGSATLVRSLAGQNLVDEYRLMVHPIVLGHGKRLLPDGFPGADLGLAEARKAGPDVLVLIYRPRPAEAGAAGDGAGESQRYVRINIDFPERSGATRTVSGFSHKSGDPG